MTPRRRIFLSVAAVLCTGLATFACNLARKPSASTAESVQSLHHSGKILLWWSGDGQTFYVKPCDNQIADSAAIDTLAAMREICKGAQEPVATPRDALQKMLVDIASADAGFTEVLRDKEKGKALAKIKDDLADGSANSDDINTQVAALKQQLKDLTANLEQTQKTLATMQAQADQTQAAAGHPASPAELDAIFGQPYRDAVKALQTMTDTQTAANASVAQQVAAYAAVQQSIAAAQTTLSGLANAALAQIADRTKVTTVSLLEKENFTAALLQTAGIRLGLLKSQAPENVSCPEVCSDDSPYYSGARCLSCRCKAAMNNSLPSPEEVNCKLAKQIRTYKLTPGGDEGFLFEELTKTASTCANPALLTGDCEYGARLGQLTKGDVHYKWICRHRSDPSAPDATYSDVGVIAHNMTTGATCFWDDYGDTITDNAFPKLDLTAATQAEVSNFENTFYNTTGESCTSCHDNDPFMFTPYLRAVDWQTLDYVSSKYATVQYDGSLKSVENKYLVSDAAAECTSCHRISDANSCSSWAKQSFGVEKGYGFEPLIAGSIDLMDGVTRKPGPDWKVAYWMPPVKTFPKVTFEQWHQKNGLAKETILKCCQNPAAQGCSWADIDGNPVTLTVPVPPATPPEAPVAPTAPIPPAAPQAPQP